MGFPSICIPCVSKRTTTYEIRKIFNKLKVGKINQIIIKKKNDNKSVFIYLHEWYTDDPKIKQMRNKLSSGEEINIVYDFPWFWKCRANHDLTLLRKINLEKKYNLQKYEIRNLKEQNHYLESYVRWLARK